LSNIPAPKQAVFSLHCPQLLLSPEFPKLKNKIFIQHFRPLW
jgi:hypothetical protein